MSNDDDPASTADGPSTGIARRSLLYGTGLVGLLGYGATAAAADPQGQVGTEADPLRALYTERLGGGLTGGQRLDSLVGTGLEVEGGTLAAPGDAPDGVRWVGQRGAEYGSVQSAIDDAADGDLVRVGPGTYEESLSWPSGKTVHLVGAGRTATTITTTDGDAGVEVAGDSELRAATVRNESTGGDAAAVAHDGSGRVVVREAVIETDGEACLRNDSGPIEVHDSETGGSSSSIVVNGGEVTVRESRLLAKKNAVTTFGGSVEVYRSQLVGPIAGNVSGARNYDRNYEDRPL